MAGADDKPEAGGEPGPQAGDRTTSVRRFRRFATAVCGALTVADYDSAAARGGDTVGVTVAESLIAAPKATDVVPLARGRRQRGLDFTIGTVISGASILPEFLSAFGRELGEHLPTGAGVTVLVLYAAIGCLIVLITNILPNRTDRASEVDLGL